MSSNTSSSNSGDLGYNGFPVSLSYFVAVPEVQLIEDPNIAVLFKSLSKKNSVTREKNLSDLVKSFNDPNCTITDAVIMCWIQLYPKLALDNSKPVRLLAHQVQGTLLRRVGGKEFGKYLKSTIPLWLLSIFDTDSPVANGSYKELLESFQNDKERVDKKLWHVFSEQIINYIHTIVCLESHESLSDLRYVKKEDSIAKYERAVVGALSMLRKLIDITNNDDSFALTDNSKQQANEVLQLDELWDPLASCSDPETINVGLFKAYLGLLKTLFDLQENKTPFPFTAQIEDLKGLYKLVSKKLIKNVKLKESEKVQPLIYSNVIIQFWDTLNVLTSFTQMDAEAKKSLKIKKNFWELAGSKAHSRLMDYIKLGHCNSDPLYYNVLKAFFRNASSVEIKSDSDDLFLDLNSSKHIKSIMKSLLLQYPKLPTFAFKKTAVDCIFVVLQLSSSKHVSDLKKEAFLTILDGLSLKRIRKADVPTRDQALEILGQSCKDLDYDAVSNDLCESISSSDKITLLGFQFKNEFQLVASSYVSLLDKDESNKLADKVLLSMLDMFELPDLTRAFEVFISCLHKGFSRETKEWIPLLPSYCTPGFTDLPFEVLRIVLDANVDWVNYEELINDVFTKVSTDVQDALPKLLGILNEAETVSEADLPEVKAYLKTLSVKKTTSSSDSEVVYNYINDPEILRNLLTSSTVHEDPERFITAVSLSGTKLANLDNDSRAGLAHVILGSLKTSSVATISSFLSLVEDENFVSTTLFSNIDKSDTSTEKVIELLSQHPRYFPLEEISQKIHQAVSLVDINSVAISNPISQNVHLGSQPTQPQLDSSIVGITRLLRSVLVANKEPSIELIAIAVLATEYLHDFLFLAQTEKALADALEEKSQLDELLNRHVFATLESVTKFFNGLDEATSIEGRIFGAVSSKGPWNVKDLYFARYTTRVFSSEFEKISLADFEALDVKVTKLANQPLILAIYLSSVSKFLGASKKLDRLRSFVFAEILGVKSSPDILELGKLWLTLAINFFNVDFEEYPEYEILPPHKMGMLINHISSWLDSDIAYEDDFLVIRSLLALFFSNLLSRCPETAPDKSWEVAFDLCLNNLSTAQLETNNIELRYLTVKLSSSLLKNTEVHGQWKETRTSLLEELCDLMLNDEIEKLNQKLDNQAVELTNEALRRAMGGSDIPNRIISDTSDKLYKALHSSKFVDIQRIATVLLQKQILSTRDDFVVEYQLNRTNLNGSEENLAQAKLPDQLLEAVMKFDEDLELSVDHRREHVTMSYLWSWLLIFAYFKDSTYGIRTDYINQLKEHNSIEHLLNVIFDHVDLSDSKFLKTLADGNVDKLNRVDPENCLIAGYSTSQGCVGEDLIYEMKFLLVHLYLMCLQYMGSFSQQWFSELRDLQLKKQVEKFSVKFISPILTSKMLNEVDESKSKLTDKDENLTIKVNRVTNEIRTIYIIDEQKMEMIVKIPETFPLSSVLVLGPLRLGVKENQWKAWLLASQRVVSLTNGSITDCIELFNRNVNLHFSGFEECAICYSILHQDHSLPSKTCPTCLNKFHAACLYKWFKSSGSSTCPLCRTAFNFRAARA